MSTELRLGSQTIQKSSHSKIFPDEQLMEAARCVALSPGAKEYEDGEDRWRIDNREIAHMRVRKVVIRMLRLLFRGSYRLNLIILGSLDSLEERIAVEMLNPGEQRQLGSRLVKGIRKSKFAIKRTKMKRHLVHLSPKPHRRALVASC